MNWLCVTLLLLQGLSTAVGELKWDTQKLSGCSLIFGQSIRERSRQQQEDPLLIWIGAPSEALQVASKHGRLPIVSLWRSFVNVLYITGCEDPSSKDEKSTAQIIDQWVLLHDGFRDRALYLSGVDRVLPDSSTYLGAVAKDLLTRRYHIAGLFIGKPLIAPSARFFGHRSFETGNKMNGYTISRALNPVSCNSLYSQVEFVMHDAIFYYTPEARYRSSIGRDTEEMTEYSLASVSTFDKCYSDLTAFESAWTNRSPYLSDIHPTLPQDPRSVHSNQVLPFPACDSVDYSMQYSDLLGLNVTLYMYSFIHKESKPICSFYIGIFETDGLRFPGVHQSLSGASVSSFNKATLYDIEDSWTRYVDEHTVHDRDSFSQLGQIQDAASAGSFSGQRIAWMHLDSRMDSKRRTGLLMLSKMTAVDILSRLMNENVLVEYVELFV